MSFDAEIRSQASPSASYTETLFSELPLDRLKIEDAKPIFVFDSVTESAFLRKCGRWAFPIHFTLAKTGLRIGELVHLLIEEVDLDGGWLHVRNKTELGWRVKTGQERSVPLIPELVGVLRTVIGVRRAGPVFLRERITKERPLVIANRREMDLRLRELCAESGKVLTRREEGVLARKVWWDAGALKSDAIRVSFIRLMKAIGRPHSTCPKSWRHTFATLLQDANVDPLIRQQTMGHQPSDKGGLGMTAKYTHTRPETQREQVGNALRRWSDSLEIAVEWVKGAEQS